MQLIKPKWEIALSNPRIGRCILQLTIVLFRGVKTMIRSLLIIVRSYKSVLHISLKFYFCIRYFGPRSHAKECCVRPCCQMVEKLCTLIQANCIFSVKSKLPRRYCASYSRCSEITIERDWGRERNTKHAMLPCIITL